jgi:hypothetical protein
MPTSEPDYQCPICDKRFRHLKPSAPVMHVWAGEHRLQGEVLEAVTINQQRLWA